MGWLGLAYLASKSSRFKVPCSLKPLEEGGGVDLAWCSLRSVASREVSVRGCVASACFASSSIPFLTPLGSQSPGFSQLASEVMQNAPTHPSADEELVVLDLDAPPQSNISDAPESLFEKLKRCGNPKGSTPLPWPQLSVVALVSLSEGTPRERFTILKFAFSAALLTSVSLLTVLSRVILWLLQVSPRQFCFPSLRS